MLLKLVSFLLLLCLFNSSRAVADEEFFGPFPNWSNLKRDYGAKGDGVADDTAALQKALDDLKADDTPQVLWLPSGTYRITRGLTMSSHYQVSVLGENPATTTIRWDGETGGVMLDCNGVRYSRFGRVTWDGAGRAETAIQHGWDGQTPGANTYNEHADEVFRDVGFGIRAGSRGFMDAECPVLRCRFVRCSKAGLSIENFNALDWWVWDSQFENCRLGVTNTFGAGNFHVYRSQFKASSESDIAMGNTSYFSMRDNLSIGSKAFFSAGWIGAAGLVTLQNNTILDPTGPLAIQIGNLGPTLLLDNTIRSGGNQPVVKVNLAQTTLAIGNTFSAPNAISSAQLDARVREINNRTVAPEKIANATFDLPAVPPLSQRPIIKVDKRADSAAIQAAIDRAVAQKNAIVHLPSGDYEINQTLNIPAASAVAIVGDGLRTRLKWTGDKTSAVLNLAGPSRATLRDFEINAGDAATGLQVQNCDQIGARIWMEQAAANNGRAFGLLADGLDNAQVNLHDWYHSGNKGVAVAVRGGTQTKAGQQTTSRVAIFGGASSDNALSYDVMDNGRLLAQDIWYEGAPPRFINFTDQSSGSFTLNGATTATGRPGPNTEADDPNFAALAVNGFRGDLTLLNIIVGTKMVVSGQSAGANIFAMLHGTDEYFRNLSNDARAVLWGSTKYTEGGGATPISNQGAADDAFVLKMLAPLRTIRPRALDTVPAGLTDVRLHRVVVSGGDMAMRLGR